MSPFPVADSPETTPPGPGSNTCTHLAKEFLPKTLDRAGTIYFLDIPWTEYILQAQYRVPGARSGRFHPKVFLYQSDDLRFVTAIKSVERRLALWHKEL